MILYQNVDLKLNASYETLYFHNYTPDLVNHQKIKRDQVFIISYMTLNPQWRKTNTNFSISELLISFVVLEFNFSNAQRIIGYFRNNRSTNQILFNFEQTITMYNFMLQEIKSTTTTIN